MKFLAPGPRPLALSLLLMACAITLGAEPLHLFCAPAPAPLHLFDQAPCAADPTLRLFEDAPCAMLFFDAPQPAAVSALEPANASRNLLYENVFHREAPNLQPVPEKTPRLIAVYGPLWCNVCRQMEREVGEGDKTLRLAWWRDENQYPQWVKDQAKLDGYPVIHLAKGPGGLISGRKTMDQLHALVSRAALARGPEKQ